MKEFYCPITLEIMENPVVICDGTSYEYKAIDTWFAEHKTSPMTNLLLQNQQITPNTALNNQLYY